MTLKPIDLSRYPHWQKLVDANPAYRKAWLAGTFPPIRGTHWDVTQPSRGLGDTIAKLTHATGIDKVVKKISKATRKPCGCQQRQAKLNRWWPYAQASEATEKAVD